MAISISAVKRKDRNTVESSSAWPDASNTGPSGTLTNSGSLTITTPGTTVQDLNITGGIEVQAANVTIRNCSINGPAYFVIDLYASADTVLIEDCYIAGGVNAGILFEDGCSNVTVRRCEFTGNEDGMKGSGSYITIQDCYIHDPLVQGEDPHNDGFQIQGADHIMIDHNWIHWKDTSCVSMFQGQGVVDTVTIQNNHLSLDPGGFLLYCGGTDGTNIKVLNNVLGNWTFGPVTDWNASGTGNVWSGNTLASNGSTVNP